MNNQIITSALDTDKYEYTMKLAKQKKHPNVIGTYEYTLRSKENLLHLVEPIREQVRAMNGLQATIEENIWLEGSIPGAVSHTYDSSTIGVYQSTNNCGLKIISEDVIAESSMWEVPTLAIVSELYFRDKYRDNYDAIEDMLFDEVTVEVFRAKLLTKRYPTIKFNVSEFGTRRRFSRRLQKRVIELLVNELDGHLTGTSNLSLAMKYNLEGIGTVAHAWTMLYQGLVHPADSQVMALRDWNEVFPNSIALTDTLGSEKWERDFTVDLAKAYKGQRHDSANPYNWGAKRVESYIKQGINPLDKSFVFSDGLTLSDGFMLSKHFDGKIGRVDNGIGTSLTNPTIASIGHKALQQVMKLVKVNGRAVAKLSDNPEKSQCPYSDEHLTNLRFVAKNY